MQGNVKKQNEVSGPYATATVADDHGDARGRPIHGIVPDGLLMPSLGVLERKELLPLLARPHVASRRSSHKLSVFSGTTY